MLIPLDYSYLYRTGANEWFVSFFRGQQVAVHSLEDDKGINGFIKFFGSR